MHQAGRAGAMLAASSAWGFETNYDRGRVDFAGRVTDISCSVALNGGQQCRQRQCLAGAGQPGGSPRSRGRGIYETAAFTLELSNCQLRHDGGAADKDEMRRSACAGLMVLVDGVGMKTRAIWRIPCGWGAEYLSGAVDQ
jgi:hypothetical protein